MFRISIPPLDTGNDYKHTATSWQVASDPEFNNLLVNDVKDETNLTEKMIDLPLHKDDLYYVRMKLHFDDGSSTSWSKPIIVTKDMDGFSVNNTIVGTPEIISEYDPHNFPLGGFNLKTSDFVLFTGTGNHRFTDWRIEDINGNLIWERRNTTNLTEIRMPSRILETGKTYIIKARYRTDTNAFSNWSKLIVNTAGRRPECSFNFNEEVTLSIFSLINHMDAVERANERLQEAS
jgi:hypothetical protein